MLKSSRFSHFGNSPSILPYHVYQFRNIRFQFEFQFSVHDPDTSSNRQDNSAKANIISILFLEIQ